MSGLLGCELCERAGVEAVGTTHLGGHRYEVCSQCRQIVKRGRRQIEELAHPSRILFSSAACPSCHLKGTVGPGSVDGKPGCSHCLYEFLPEEWAALYR